MRVEDTLFIFESVEDKQAFVEAEEQAKQAINRAARRNVIATRPKPVVVPVASFKGTTEHDYQRFIAAYFEQLEDEDIEALLLA